MTTKKHERLNPESRIALTAAAKDGNPRRPGTAAHKRAGCVLRANGKTVRDALRAGARTSTVKHMAAEGLVRLLAPAKVAAKKAA